jgi:hypothetical protein
MEAEYYSSLIHEGNFYRVMIILLKALFILFFCITPIFQTTPKSELSHTVHYYFFFYLHKLET